MRAMLDVQCTRVVNEGGQRGRCERGHEDVGRRQRGTADDVSEVANKVCRSEKTEMDVRVKRESLWPETKRLVPGKKSSEGNVAGGKDRVRKPASQKLGGQGDCWHRQM